jgi:hypothetical protein
MTINDHNLIFLLKSVMPPIVMPHQAVHVFPKHYASALVKPRLAPTSGKKWLVTISGFAIWKRLAIFGHDTPTGGAQHRITSGSIPFHRWTISRI